MFLVVLIVCVMSAGGSYLVRSIQAGSSSPLVFVIFVVAAPLMVLVLVNAVLNILDRFRRR
jgi:hypothetical protein